MKEIEKALINCFVSERVINKHGGPANVIDSLEMLHMSILDSAAIIAKAINNLADAIRDSE